VNNVNVDPEQHRGNRVSEAPFARAGKKRSLRRSQAIPAPQPTWAS